LVPGAANNSCLVGGISHAAKLNVFFVLSKRSIRSNKEGEVMNATAKPHVVIHFINNAVFPYFPTTEREHFLHCPFSAEACAKHTCTHTDTITHI
jgi:hypothetical protein